MYYSEINIYISNNVLFDLNNMDIYLINDEVIKIIDSLNNGDDNEIIKGYKDYKMVKETFFKDRLKNEMNIENGSEIFDKVMNLQIKVSNTCNLACKYCYAAGGNYNKKDNLMSVDIAKNMCNKINDMFPNVEKISFFGGEPLLNIPVIDIFTKELKNKNIIYSLVTNGTKVDDSLLDILKNHNVKVVVSLDGTKEMHDENRISKLGQGTFDLVDSNIKRIQKETDAIKMIEGVYSSTSYNKMSKIELYQYLYDRYNVRNIGLGEVYTNDPKMKLPKEYYDGLILTINEEIDFFISKVVNKQFIPINKVNDIMIPIISKKPTIAFCGAGLASLFIEENGDIYPCQLFVNDKIHYMGNMFGECSKLTSEVIRAQSIIKKNNIKGNIDECRGCICKFWCFKCIGQHKDEQNYGCCKTENCSYYRELTLRTLNKVSKMVKSGEFNKLIDGYKFIMHNTI